MGQVEGVKRWVPGGWSEVKLWPVAMRLVAQTASWMGQGIS